MVLLVPGQDSHHSVHLWYAVTMVVIRVINDIFRFNNHVTRGFAMCVELRHVVRFCPMPQSGKPQKGTHSMVPVLVVTPPPSQLEVGVSQLEVEVIQIDVVLRGRTSWWDSTPLFCVFKCSSIFVVNYLLHFYLSTFLFVFLLFGSNTLYKIIDKMWTRLDPHTNAFSSL